MAEAMYIVFYRKVLRVLSSEVVMSVIGRLSILFRGKRVNFLG